MTQEHQAPDIDFSVSMWGHSIERQWSERGPMADGRERVQGNVSPKKAKVGSTFKMADGSIWVFDEIEFDSNPPDLFFGIARPL